MTIHAPDGVLLAFLRWVDRCLEFQPQAGRRPLETHALRPAAEAKWREYLAGELWDCAHTLPDAYCDRLQMARGSTYGEAVRRTWREHLGQEDKPVL